MTICVTLQIDDCDKAAVSFTVPKTDDMISVRASVYHLLQTHIDSMFKLAYNNYLNKADIHKLDKSEEVDTVNPKHNKKKLSTKAEAKTE